jgi:hypothetical protein
MIEGAYGKQLRGFLGTWGCQTQHLDDEDLLDVAKRAFDVPGKSIVAVTIAVDRLGRAERSARIREAMRKHWPEPSRLWPANAPVRRLLAAEQA